MKKFGLGLLMSLIAVSLVFANGQQGGGKSGGAGSKGDMHGMEVIIGNWWENYDTNDEAALKAANLLDTTIAENNFEWRKEIQKDYNVHIVNKNIASWEEYFVLASQSIMAGEPNASIYQMQPDWAASMRKQNLLYPIGKTTSIDFSQKVGDQDWNAAATDAFTFGGVPYGVSLGIGQSAHVIGLFFNKRLLTEAGINPEAPYDMQKAGTWTWDAFLDMLKKTTRDTDNDGVMDTYGLVGRGNAHDLITGIIFSNDASFVTKDASGKFVNNTGTPEFLEALQFCMKIAEEKVCKEQPSPDSAWNWWMDDFRAGAGAFVPYEEWWRNDLKDMKDDWGFVLMPKGPKAQDYACVDYPNYLVIPSTVSDEDANNIILAYALFNTPSPKNGDQAQAWKTDLYPRYRDRRAVDETIAMIRDPKYAGIAYYKFIPGLEKGDITWSLMWDGVDPAQLIESVSQKWNATIAAAN
ncbi:MAG: extracellular solute-binding protein [Spirochaetaceae bacterium]|jgi:hypothetical protein|nr:extracellular solute-binding protein [Spirochaetaceae bacterium]